MLRRMVSLNSTAILRHHADGGATDRCYVTDILTLIMMRPP
jgi:hypothetical protein